LTSSTVLLSDPTINSAMATEVTLGGAGQRLVTYRKIDDLSGANKDLGKIARRWFGSFTSGTSEEELVLTNTANRPHTSVISFEGRSYLCTCWSQKDAELGTVDQVLRVEEIVE
jgi:hypothetical protein